MADYTAYYKGEWIPYSQVMIDPSDRGFRVGDLVFDAERTFNGKIFRLQEHMDRLYRSIKAVRIDPGLMPEEMGEISEEAVRRNEHLRAEVGDFNVTQWVSRGPGRWAWSAGPATVCVKVDAIDFDRYAGLYEDGAHAVIARTRSYSPDTLDPKIKHYNRMNMNMSELEAADIDPEAWPLLTDAEGNVTEGSGYNVFLVSGGVIRTPGDRSILQGVSRGMVFDLARQLDIPLVEEDIQPYDMYNADEAFFASSSLCVLPLTVVDKRDIGDGRPGPITEQLLSAWSETAGLDIVDQAMQFYRG